jgi:hypothetical protein
MEMGWTVWKEEKARKVGRDIDGKQVDEWIRR